MENWIKSIFVQRFNLNRVSIPGRFLQDFTSCQISHYWPQKCRSITFPHLLCLVFVILPLDPPRRVSTNVARCQFFRHCLKQKGFPSLLLDVKRFHFQKVGRPSVTSVGREYKVSPHKPNWPVFLWLWLSLWPGFLWREFPNKTYKVTPGC